MNKYEIKKFVLELERPDDSNKYDYGHILIVAGSKFMPGAGVLCSNAAMRAGAGLVTHAVGENFLAQTASMSKPETMFFIYKNAGDIIDFINGRKVSSVVIGPGLEKSDELSDFIEKIAASVDLPLILDAAALTLNLPLKGAKAKLILTPHLGEFKKMPSSVISKDFSRESAVRNFALQNFLVFLLKGHNTVVSDGNNIYINETGTPAMATAGSGDVLSGIIAAFAARGFAPFEAAKFGVYVHGLAGESAQKEKGENGVIASDICENVPYVLRQLTING